MRKYKEELKAHIVYSIFLYHLGSSHQKSVSFSSGVVRDWTLFLYKLLFSQGPMIQDMLTFNVHTRERQPYPPDRMWYKRASTLKLLDAVYHSALRFSTGDVYSTHHCNLYKKKIKKKLCGPLSSLCLSVCLSVCLQDVMLVCLPLLGEMPSFATRVHWTTYCKMTGRYCEFLEFVLSSVDLLLAF